MDCSRTSVYKEQLELAEVHIFISRHDGSYFISISYFTEKSYTILFKIQNKQKMKKHDCVTEKSVAKELNLNSWLLMFNRV